MRVMHMCEANCSNECLKLECILAVSLLIKLHWVHLEGVSYLQILLQASTLLHHGQADCKGLEQQDLVGTFSFCYMLQWL